MCEGLIPTIRLHGQDYITRPTPAHQPPSLEDLISKHSQQGQGVAARYSQGLQVAIGDACFLCTASNHQIRDTNFRVSTTIMEGPV